MTTAAHDVRTVEVELPVTDLRGGCTRRRPARGASRTSSDSFPFPRFVSCTLAALALLSVACQRKNGLVGTYSGAFMGTRMGPAARGGVQMTPISGGAKVTIA